MAAIDFQQAEFDVRKLNNYCLDPTHPLGRHKARVFRAALGLTDVDADWLRATILDLVRTADTEVIAGDKFGIRHRADLTIARHERTAVVRTIWIVPAESRWPRFVTCWIV